MVENLLHASVVLSKRQYAALAEESHHGTIRVPNSHIGTLIFLGTTDQGGLVHLLLQLDDEYNEDSTPKVIETVCGSDFLVISETEGYNVRRALINVKLEGILRDPAGFTRTKARQLASAFMAAYRREIMELVWEDDARAEEETRIDW